MKGLDQIIRDNNDAFDRAEPLPHFDSEEQHCPYCDGYGVLLGQLGHIEHLKCRSCGFLFNNDTEREL